MTRAGTLTYSRSIRSILCNGKAKNIRLKLTVQDGLEVIIPHGFDQTRIPPLLQKKRIWITEAMKRLREVIQYKLETTGKGARIRITTKNPEALRAVHEFLRFQTSDHQTGDSLDLAKEP